jgi:hypothetical protein
MWRADPALGLWYFMQLNLTADGRITATCDYERRPTIDEVPVDVTEARTDLLRAPRPERWVPAWLAAP